MITTTFAPPDVSQFTSASYRGQSPATQWLVANRLPRGRVAVLAAQGGTGKSWQLCELFCAINDGYIPFVWGGYVAHDAKGLPCVILAAEDGFAELDSRLKTIRSAYGGAGVDHGLILPTGDIGGMSLFKASYGGGPIERTDAYEWLEQQLKVMIAEHGKLGFIAIDTLAALANFSENDNGEATAVMQGLTQLAAKYDVAVIVSHHYAKGGSSDRGAAAIRGASAIVNSARLAFGLDRLDGAETKEALAAVGATEGRAIRLSILKSNVRVDTRSVTLAWPENSAMIDVSDLVGDSDAASAMLAVIRRLNTEGRRVTKSGTTGVYEIRSDAWPSSLRKLGRNVLREVVQGLIDAGKVEVLDGGLVVAGCAAEPVTEGRE